MTSSFSRRHLLSVDAVSSADVSALFDHVAEMKQLVEKKGGDDRLKGTIMAALFYEPSSRTMASFITAMQRLGGGIIPISAMKEHSSVVKGETIQDTARVFSSYADVLVIRHPEVGAPAQLAQAASVPVINAGDGAGEHPTQALLDTYTIHQHFSDFKGITVGLIGDLLYGRTVHSLSKLLVRRGVRRFMLISPSALRMPTDIVTFLKEEGATVEEQDRLIEHVSDLDVLYVTRVQKERFADVDQYEGLKDVYHITPDVMRLAKGTAVLMHPLPRVGEISPEVDDDPRALYFREQTRNGLYVRMAILDRILR